MVEEIGLEGVKQLRKTLKFGDIVINHWASERNPQRKGVFVMYKGQNIHVTDMKGNFWIPILAADSKIEVVGNIFQPINNWKEQARLYAELMMYKGENNDGWDRNDGINIGIFYNHMLNFISDTYDLSIKPNT